jgi:hypothetical protein
MGRAIPPGENPVHRAITCRTLNQGTPMPGLFLVSGRVLGGTSLGWLFGSAGR